MSSTFLEYRVFRQDILRFVRRWFWQQPWTLWWNEQSLIKGVQIIYLLDVSCIEEYYSTGTADSLVSQPTSLSACWCPGEETKSACLSVWRLRPWLCTSSSLWITAVPVARWSDIKRRGDSEQRGMKRAHTSITCFYFRMNQWSLSLSLLTPHHS